MHTPLNLLSLTSFIATAGLGLGCGADIGHDALDQELVQVAEAFEDDLRARGQWGRSEDPERSAKDPERSSEAPVYYGFSDLPRSGRVKYAPWPGYSWSTVVDSINLQWQGPGTFSPAAKYAKLMRLDVDEVEDAISRHGGVDGQAHRATCTSDKQCHRSADELCAKREGELKGYCVPSRLGMSHGWAASATLLDEPSFPVRRGGVTFEPNDIKALLSQIYDGTRPDLVVERSENERPREKDLNPGALLVLLGNKLGLDRQSWIADTVIDGQTVSRPVSAYKLTSVERLDAKGANALVAERWRTEVSDKYAFNDKARQFRYVSLRMSYVSESVARAVSPLLDDAYAYETSETYTAVIELDRHGLIIGGEWTSTSTGHYPARFWSAADAVKEARSSDGVLQWDEVMSLHRESLRMPRDFQVAKHEDRVAPSSWKFYGPYTVKPGHSLTAKLRAVVPEGERMVRMRGGSFGVSVPEKSNLVTLPGNANVYVREGKQPGSGRGAWDCRGKFRGGRPALCNVHGGGEYYVGVRGDSDDSGSSWARPSTDFQLEVSYTGEDCGRTS